MPHPSTSATYAPRIGAVALLLAAFDGVPQPGTRELRLSPAECQALTERFPGIALLPLEPSGDKTWYQVTLA